MYLNKMSQGIALAILLGAFASSAQSAEFYGIDFKGSGFLTLAAGDVLNGGGYQAASGYHCPCFISDYTEAGVYQTGGLQWHPDSKLGLQGTAAFNDRYSMTSQIVAHGASGKVEMEWLYATIRLGNKLTLQAGRKRLPLFYYSETQDVGMSYPWVHLPPQLYGWEIVNYNGANLLYEDQRGEWSSGLNLFTGSETSKDSGYWKIYNGLNSSTDARWSNIAGSYLSLNNDWFETRLLYIQSNIANSAQSTLGFVGSTRQKIYGISFNADYGQWVARSEFLYINRKESYGGDHTQLYGLGYRIGKLMPMITYNNYRQSVHQDAVAGLYPSQAEAHSTTSLLLRYSLNNTSDLKLQFDQWHNHAQPPFFTASPYTAIPSASVNLLSASYDKVF